MKKSIPAFAHASLKMFAMSLCCAGCQTMDPPSGFPSFLQFTFDTSPQGWHVVEGSFSEPTTPTHESDMGSPGGAVSALGEAAWYWQAPASLRGNQVWALGRFLTFDLNQSHSGGCAGMGDMVIVTSGEDAISIPAPYIPGKGWTNYRVALDASAGWRVVGTGDLATAAQITGILLNVTDLRIRGWYYGCGVVGSGGLDNVVFGAEPGDALPLVGDRISSTFDTDDEGWAVAGGEFGRGGPLAWESEGGALDGHIAATGESDWYWLAPPSYRGDASNAYGRYLKFDLNQSHAGGCSGGDKLVVLNGGGLAIYYDAKFKPDKTWTSYSIRLHETEQWFNAVDAKRVTASQMQAVLADLQQIKIRGWFFGCGVSGTGGIDNVVLQLNDAPESPLRGLISSEFDVDADNWMVAGGLLDRLGVIEHMTTGGSPDGHLTAVGGGDWYWIAPPKFKGDASGARGRTLSFVLKSTSMGGCAGDEAVLLNGGGYSILYRVPMVPQNDWTSYSVKLSETELWFHVETGQRVTGAEMQRLLADLSGIRIRGWFHGCGTSGIGGIDSVVLDAGP